MNGSDRTALDSWSAVRATVVPWALAGIERTTPFYFDRSLPADLRGRSPAEVFPIFGGCYDWHSSVHSHWLLLRAWKLGADANVAEALDERLTIDAARREAEIIDAHPNFEVPYGIAWLLKLMAEVQETSWSEAMAPLASAGRRRFLDWLSELHEPVAHGEHSQTAFALGLGLEWACAVNDSDAESAIRTAAIKLFSSATESPLHSEPGAHDFLSPTLGAADLMAKVAESDVAYAAWLDGFAPTLGRELTLEPVTPVDRSDGKLAHWDGLNLSRARMLWHIANALPQLDPRVKPLQELAEQHGTAGLRCLEYNQYAGTHWLGTFVIRWFDAYGFA